MESEEVKGPFCQIPIERLRQLLRYNPETGKLYWRSRGNPNFDSRCAGNEALIFIGSKGYLQGKCDGVRLKAHRAAWALQRGRWPAAQIDHINGDRRDNRIVNLREATATEQQRNRRRSKNNTSGCVGVSFNAAEKKWWAYIKIDRKRIVLGRTRSFASAVAMRKAAEIEAGFHPNHGSEPIQGSGSRR